MSSVPSSSSSISACSNEAAVYTIESSKIVLVFLEVIFLKLAKSIQAQPDQASMLKRNRIAVVLTTLSHVAYLGTVLASIVEQQFVNTSDSDFTALWNQFQLGNAALQSVQAASNGYYLYGKQHAQKKPAGINLTEPEIKNDSWKSRMTSTARMSVLHATVFAQIAFSTLVMVVLYKQCN